MKVAEFTPEFIHYMHNAIRAGIAHDDDPKNRKVTKIFTKECELYVEIYITTDCDGWAESTFCLAKSYDDLFRGKEGVCNLQERYIGQSEETVRKDIENLVANPLPALLQKLFQLEEWGDVVQDDDGLKYAQNLPAGFPTELADEVESWACGELITGSGNCNWSNIRALKKLGYDVYAGDKDSFGWLTGCIEKDGKVLVYG